MGKDEFLQRLRQALEGEVSQSVIQENIGYYNGYIAGEVQKGLSEEAVTAEIGDPRLIARTIIDASAGAGGSSYTGYSDAGRSSCGEEERPRQDSFRHIDLSKWYWKLLSIAVVSLVVFLVISIVSGLFALIMPLLGPVLMVLLILWFLKGIRR